MRPCLRPCLSTASPPVSPSPNRGVFLLPKIVLFGEGEENGRGENPPSLLSPLQPRLSQVGTRGNTNGLIIVCDAEEIVARPSYYETASNCWRENTVWGRSPHTPKDPPFQPKKDWFIEMETGWKGGRGIGYTRLGKGARDRLLHSLTFMERGVRGEGFLDSGLSLGRRAVAEGRRRCRHRHGSRGSPGRRGRAGTPASGRRP
jgi:hypothetical protein